MDQLSSLQESSLITAINPLSTTDVILNYVTTDPRIFALP